MSMFSSKKYPQDLYAAHNIHKNAVVKGELPEFPEPPIKDTDDFDDESVCLFVEALAQAWDHGPMTKALRKTMEEQAKPLLLAFLQTHKPLPPVQSHVSSATSAYMGEVKTHWTVSQQEVKSGHEALVLVSQLNKIPIKFLSVDKDIAKNAWVVYYTPSKTMPKVISHGGQDISEDCIWVDGSSASTSAEAIEVVATLEKISVAWAEKVYEAKYISAKDAWLVGPKGWPMEPSPLNLEDLKNLLNGATSSGLHVEVTSYKPYGQEINVTGPTDGWLDWLESVRCF